MNSGLGTGAQVCCNICHELAFSKNLLIYANDACLKHRWVYLSHDKASYYECRMVSHNCEESMEKLDIGIGHYVNGLIVCLRSLDTARLLFIRCSTC